MTAESCDCDVAVPALAPIHSNSVWHSEYHCPALASTTMLLDLHNLASTRLACSSYSIAFWRAVVQVAKCKLTWELLQAAMPSTVALFGHEPVTYEQAQAKEFNVIERHNQIALCKKLYRNLWDHRKAMSRIVKQQLSLDDGAKCIIPPPREWLRGTFNICIPIEIKSRSFSKRLILRCPMPFKHAERYYPGSVDEKLRSEIGAYAWLQEHCPDVRIPTLYGFSLSSHHV